MHRAHRAENHSLRLSLSSFKRPQLIFTLAHSQLLLKKRENMSGRAVCGIAQPHRDQETWKGGAKPQSNNVPPRPTMSMQVALCPISSPAVLQEVSYATSKYHQPSKVH